MDCYDCRKKNTCVNAYRWPFGCNNIELTDEAEYYKSVRNEYNRKKNKKKDYTWLLED